jgi:hypothetical protein
VATESIEGSNTVEEKVVHPNYMKYYQDVEMGLKIEVGAGLTCCPGNLLCYVPLQRWTQWTDEFQLKQKIKEMYN